MGIINFGNKPQTKSDGTDVLRQQLEAKLEALRKENEQLRAKALKGSTTALGGKLSAKVSEKGAVSVYGFGRFPVTLYATQWDELLTNSAGLVKFIQDNAEKLTFKTKD